ncbi:YidC/Oxa1 family membrane protein insertase [Micromonospora sp. HM134]|uniref:YidC/Oxa1 family membrane protein insertase n=1 Tax=unclassified Micromonospora TaxID=2617518 RepID=UPI001198C484|nr:MULTISPECIES: membrane protein insertase YidC [unclassified Micromonospora]QDY10366.1 YidC/Oxa1 family membrane protein insertase [Micromonospora sp. HM134]
MLAFSPVHDAAAAAGSVVGWLAGLLTPLAGGVATAVAIVLFTIAVRLLISPLTVAQVRAERRRAALAPQLRQLQQRYAGDPATLQSEVFALYRGAGASPVAGCLPALLQAPFFLVMYRLFGTGDGAGGLLDARLAGVPLGWHLGDGLTPSVLLVFGVLLAALAGLATVLSRRAAASAAVPADQPGAALLARVLPLLPYGTVLLALVVPLAAVLYLVTTTGWTVAEHVLLRRPRPVPAGAIDER